MWPTYAAYHHLHSDESSTLAHRVPETPDEGSPAVFSSTFWKAAAERAVKTFAQASLALITGDGIGVLDVNWGDIASIGALAALASVLTSVVSAPFGPSGSPSVVEDEAAAGRHRAE
jgi:hypothetical protein